MNCIRWCSALTPAWAASTWTPIKSSSAASAATTRTPGVTVSHKMFAPRVGLAYRLDDATVIRMGYGISYDPLPMSRVFRDPYPLTIPQSFTGPNSFTPYASISAGIPPVHGA